MRIRPLLLTGAAAAAVVLAAAGSASAATVSTGSPAAQGTASDLTATPASLTFGPLPESATQPSAPQTVTITDTSSLPVHIAQTDVADENYDFELSPGTCGEGDVTLEPGGSCTIQIVYLPLNAPGQITNFAAVIAGDFNDTVTALDIPLTGTSVADS